MSKSEYSCLVRVGIGWPDDVIPFAHANQLPLLRRRKNKCHTPENTEAVHCRVCVRFVGVCTLLSDL